MSSAFLGSDCVGRIIDGRFTLLRWLGGTDQSSVFFTELEGDPAQKAVIKLSLANAADAEARIAQWETSKTLSHPHLMRLFYGGRCEVDGVEMLYMVTEYADEILSEILRERPLTSGETKEMLDPVLEALSWLHGRGLVHGHLKPSKIMVVGDRLKLSIDRLHAAGEPGRASAGYTIYDAPEAALETMSPAADVWSLGVVLVEALTQRPPLWDRSGGGEPVVPASIPPPFFCLARECLRVNSAARATLSGVRDSLQAAPAAEPPDEIPGIRASRALPSRARMMIAGVVLVVVGIVAAGVIGLVRSSHQRQRPSAVQQTPTPANRPRSPDPGAQLHEGSAVGSVVNGAVASRATPEVPQSIRDTQGHVQVRIAVEVDSDGNVANATIESRGPSRYFANRALEAARNWKFRPAEVGGRAVASKWILQFRFGRDGSTISPTETSP